MNLTEFTKNKEFLICIDADGCAFNSREIEQTTIFAPCMIKEWELEKWADATLEKWKEVNLYASTRGSNRFQSLLIALTEIDAQYKMIEGLGLFEYWVETSFDHSYDSLKAELERTGNVIFEKALRWSEAVDQQTEALPVGAKKPFDGLKEALAYAHEYADIAIISSKKEKALHDEWEAHGLLDYVDVMCSDSEDNIVQCIQEIRKHGYPISRFLVVGDTVQDMKAAQKNGVYFYPILVNEETESWSDFMTVAVENLTSAKFAGPYQRYLLAKFNSNLTK